MQHYPAEQGVRDPARRAAKADKLWAMLAEAGLPADPAALRALDVGCASGLIAARLAGRLGWVVGVEYDAEALGGEVGRAPNLLLVRGDGGRLPIANEAMQVVICAQVYEHTPDAEALAAEIYRVLAPGGVCLFTGPNRLAPIEPHYGLPLLSWLPRRWAHGVLRLAGLGREYDIRPLTWWGLRRLWRRFAIRDLTPDLIRQPERFHCADELGGLGWLGRLPAWLLRLAAPLYPNYNWVLIKQTAISDQRRRAVGRRSLKADGRRPIHQGACLDHHCH